MYCKIEKNMINYILLKNKEEVTKKCHKNIMEQAKENEKIIRKKVFENIVIAIVVMIYLISINFIYLRGIDQNIILNIVKVASIVILGLSIVIFEIAYHKDSGKLTINGIEALVLAFYTLTVFHIVNKFSIRFEDYILLSTYAFAIYYVLKSILIYTREKRNFVKGLSDIHEIVQNEPVKKEAKKRNKEKSKK